MIERWLIVRDAKEVGPYSSYQLRDFANDGALIPDDYVRRYDMTAAIHAKSIKELLQNLGEKPPYASLFAEVLREYFTLIREKSVDLKKKAIPHLQELKTKLNTPTKKSESLGQQIGAVVILGFFLYLGYWFFSSYISAAWGPSVTNGPSTPSAVPSAVKPNEKSAAYKKGFDRGSYWRAKHENISQAQGQVLDDDSINEMADLEKNYRQTGVDDNPFGKGTQERTDYARGFSDGMKQEPRKIGDP